MSPKGCKLLIRYTRFPSPVDRDRSPQIVETDFSNIHNLANYLRTESDRAVQLGYGKGPLPHVKNYSRTEDVKIIIYFRDEHQEITAEFTNAYAFARFLDRNPAIAECVGYTSKR